MPFRTVQISHFFTAPLALTQSYIQNNSNSQLHKNLNQLVKEIILSKLTITPVPLHSGVLPLLPLHTTQSRRHSPHCTLQTVPSTLQRAGRYGAGRCSTCARGPWQQTGSWDQLAGGEEAEKDRATASDSPIDHRANFPFFF